MATKMFWKNDPYSRVCAGKENTQWKPGELRSYIPIVHFGVPQNIPAQGLVGETTELEGGLRTTSVKRGAKTQSTYARKPRNTK